MKPESNSSAGNEPHGTTPSMELLLQEARSGQKLAVDNLLNRHREPLRRMIGLRLDPAIAAREDASDIVQNVLIEAHKRIENYLKNPVMPFHLWLRHIAKDHIIDAHRRHRLAQRRSLDREQSLAPTAISDQSSMEIAGQLVDDGITPASEAVRKELAERVRMALGELEPDDREIILMRGMEQMSNQQVAEILHLTEAAASMRHLRALRRLKQVLVPDMDNS
jgi:RNA polymerase sigma-70 factor (ECF subfamily)